MRLLMLAGLLVTLPTIAGSSGIDADAWVKEVLAGPAGREVGAELARARAAAEATGLWANPALRLERQSGPILDQSKGSQDFFALEVPVSFSGRLGVAHEAAQLRVDAAALDLRAARARVAREALDVYVDVVAGNRRTRVLAEERTRLATVVSSARKRATAGESANATALRLELELARVDDDVAAATAAVNGARRRAAALVGGVAPTFADTMPAQATRVFGSANDAATPATPASLLALERRASAAALDEEAAVRRVVPDVTVGGGPSFLNTGSPEFAVGYLVTVGVDLPLFDYGQGDRARARAERLAVDAGRDALSRRLEGALADAELRAASARARSEAFGAAVAAAAGIFDAAASDLAFGDGDVVAFVDAAAALREARLQLIALQDQSARADADLSLLVGALDSSPESRP